LYSALFRIPSPVPHGARQHQQSPAARQLYFLSLDSLTMLISTLGIYPALFACFK
jgi:hypothetical protein